MHTFLVAALFAVFAFLSPGTARADVDGYLGARGDAFASSQFDSRYYDTPTERRRLPIGSAWQVTVWSTEFEPEVSWRVAYVVGRGGRASPPVQTTTATYGVGRNDRGRVYWSRSCFRVHNFLGRGYTRTDADLTLYITSRRHEAPGTQSSPRGRYRYRIERMSNPSECGSPPSPRPTPTPTPPPRPDDPDPPIPPPQAKCPSWQQVNPRNAPHDALLSNPVGVGGTGVFYYAYGSEYISFTSVFGAPSSRLYGGPGHWHRESCDPNDTRVRDYDTEMPRIVVLGGQRWEVHTGRDGGSSVSIRR